MNRFQSWYNVQPPALRALLTINVAFYILWVLILGRIDAVEAFVFDHFALNPRLPELLYEPWQLLTYNFLHLNISLGGLLHILFNMLWLVWIGREFEQMQGSHKILAIYLISGVAGGLVTLLVYSLFPTLGSVFVYGASASVFGVMSAVATFYPYQSIGLLFIGTVRLVYVVIGLLLIDILFQPAHTAVSAHVGGALFGFLFARGERAGLDLSSWAQVFFRRSGRRRRPATSGRQNEGVFGRMEGWLASRNAGREKPSRPATVHPMRSTPAPAETGSYSLDREVDRILEKISADGYESLSDEEKRVLYEASRR